jgi:hypothetical protein
MTVAAQLELATYRARPMTVAVAQPSRLNEKYCQKPEELSLAGA